MKYLILVVCSLSYLSSNTYGQDACRVNYFESLVSEYKPKGVNIFYHRNDSVLFEAVSKIAQSYWDSCFVNYCGIVQESAKVTGMSLTDHHFYKVNEQPTHPIAYSYFDVTSHIITPDSIVLNLCVRIDSNFNLNRVSNYVNEHGYLDFCQIKSWQGFKPNILAFEDGFIGEIRSIDLNLNEKSQRFEYVVYGNAGTKNKKSLKHGVKRMVDIHTKMVVDAITGKILETSKQKYRRRFSYGYGVYN